MQAVDLKIVAQYKHSQAIILFKDGPSSHRDKWENGEDFKRETESREGINEKFHRAWGGRIKITNKIKMVETLQINHWQVPPGMLDTTPAFVRKRAGFGSTSKFDFRILCHSIAVCAPSPRWAENGTCSSALSASGFSRNAASGRKATASPACARRSRRREDFSRRPRRRCGNV
jgi:hypothetical protein